MPVCQEKFLLIFLFAFLSLPCLALGQRKRICIICFSLRGALTPCPNAFAPLFPSLSLCGGVCLLCVCVCVAQTLVRAVGRAADALMRSAFPGQQFLFCCFPHCCSVLWPCKLLLLTPPTSATTLPACTSPSSLCCCVKYSYLRFACRHTSLGDALLCFFPDKLSQHLIFI